MEKAFTHENSLIVFNLKNVLEDNGIECSIKNEYSGSGAGVLAPFDTWPEIWVENKTQLARAEKIIQQTMNDLSTRDEWVCPDCGERNDGHFYICWNCDREK